MFLFRKSSITSTLPDSKKKRDNLPKKLENPLGFSNFVKEVVYEYTISCERKQLESWALLIQECKNSGLKTNDRLAQNNIYKSSSEDRVQRCLYLTKYFYRYDHYKSWTIKHKYTGDSRREQTQYGQLWRGLYVLNNAICFNNIYIVCGRTDLRYGLDSLAVVLRSLGIENPAATNTLYLFCGRRSDRIKGLVWEGADFLLFYEKLVNGSFQRPRNASEL